MKLFAFTIIAVLAATFVEPAAPHWLTDIAKAKALAKKDGKAILIFIHGSDWCPPCIKMQKEIFEAEAFADYAAKNLILLDVDFPKEKELSAEQLKHNMDVKALYGVSKEYGEGYPTVILLDKNGAKLSQSQGYEAGGATPFLEKVGKIRAEKK